ncbi:hypothetical protein BST36_01500 [Mycolicibacterium moriokaense]|uniref:hypothetical protein n=1 Tax=Mycolicibacterium moriokaense TaxID=39691 RepID=UPI0009F1EAFB|nr:hypothetical protein [Mycolicibacterium moriokaense]MCV7041003.1 hypothetical protein [Mycolicibacterium moriokaense]ORB27373.1 hypothetical protein BST36_01500 [Mycolicibacterium moriokaense]
MTSVPTVVRRACATLAATSAVLHAAMLGHASGVFAASLLAAMIAACLYCARELWRDGTARAWVVVALMNLAMIALHLPAPAHHHGAVTSASPPSTLMAVATLLALTEVAAAAAALYIGSRGHLARLAVHQAAEPARQRQPH